MRALATGVSIALAACAAAAATGALGPAEATASRLVTLPLLLGGAALPVLLRWTPVEPSAIKVGLLALLLSPPLLTVLRFGTGAWTTALWITCGLQLLGLGARLHFQRPGRAAWLALGLAGVVAGLLGTYLGGGGWASRLGGDAQVWTAVAAEQLLRGSLEHPLLAGASFPAHPGHAALVATVAGALGLHVATAAAWVTAVAAATLPVSVMLTAAPLWGETRRVSLAPLVALLGAGGAALGWLGVPGPLGGDAALGVGAAAPALALAAGALFALAHALRHGARPWVGLAGALGGSAALLAPPLGAVVLLGGVGAALAAPGASRVRTVVPPILLAWGLPALWFARRYGSAALPFEGEPAWGGLVGAAPLAVLALVGLRDRSRAGGAEGRALCAAALTVALVAAAGAAALADAGLARLAGLAVAPLAAGGVVALAAPRTVAVALVLLAPGAWSLVSHVRALQGQARAPFQVRLADGHLEPAFPSEQDLPGTGLVPQDIVVPPHEVDEARLVRRRHRGLAYRWIRANLDELGRDAILWRSLAGDGDRGVGPARVHLAPLYAGLPLWCDTADLTAAEQHGDRRGKVRSLYEVRGSYDPHSLRELEQLERPAVFLVEEADREATYRGSFRPFRGVDVELERLGARRVHVTGTAAVYHWRPR